MELLKIAVVFAATCSVVYTFGTGRDITQYVKRAAMNRKLPILFTRWKSCTELGFHPFKSKDPVPSVSVDMVPAGTRNTSLSVTCYKPGESYDGKGWYSYTCHTFFYILRTCSIDNTTEQPSYA